MARQFLNPRLKRYMHRRTEQRAWSSNGTWIIAGNSFVNTPTQGSELLTNGNLETWSSSTNAGTWTEGVAGTSTVNQETVDIHGGSNAARLDVDGSNSTCNISQTVTCSTGDWLFLSAWLKVSSVGKTCRFDLGAVVSTTHSPTTSYVQNFHTLKAAANNPSMDISRVLGASASIYIDDVSAKKLTLNTLFVVRSGAADFVSVSANVTMAIGAVAGVIASLDSISSPANLVLAYHDGITTVTLLKCVGGTWTSLLAVGSVTYVAGALIEIRKTANTTYQLWYSGTQRGADQTVSDAGVKDNTLHGGFSTYSGNTLANLRSG